MIHVVLFQPEIPPNTGNIIRTCMASNAKLHLIKPLGFRIDDASFKRAGLDYLRSFEFETHENFQDFLDTCNPKKEHTFLITRFADYTYSDAPLSNPDADYYFVFGSETHGLPDEIHNMYEGNRLIVPMDANSRFLNLYNTVAIIVYEALRQQNFPTLSRENTLEV